jgi:hypothetical protein
MNFVCCRCRDTLCSCSCKQLDAVAATTARQFNPHDIGAPYTDSHARSVATHPDANVTVYVYALVSRVTGEAVWFINWQCTRFRCIRQINE